MTYLVQPPLRDAATVAPAEHIRRGFLAAQAKAGEISRLFPTRLNTRTPNVVASMANAIETMLREALVMALRHTTEATLRDAFAATEQVGIFLGKASRNISRNLERQDSRRWAMAAAGLRSAIAEIEPGLEHIPMLPPSADDYPYDLMTLAPQEPPTSRLVEGRNCVHGKRRA